MKNFLVTLILLASTTFMAQQQDTRHLLSSKAMEAYSIKSESKVNEFFDYLELLSDPRLNADMKAHTTAEALKLFDDGTIPMDNIIDKKNGETNLKALLAKLASGKKKYVFKVIDFSSQPQDETGDRQLWKVTYKLLINDRTELDISQEFFIVYEDKLFGKTSKKVWNTYLGKITIGQ